MADGVERVKEVAKAVDEDNRSYVIHFAASASDLTEGLVLT